MVYTLRNKCRKSEPSPYKRENGIPKRKMVNTMKTKIAGLQDWVSGNGMKERGKDRERK